ncbi:hypothetical protein C0J52_26921 [Blattella germanica]|nr:hypothetical protein C0J52_26921 [Blattella germanica]
MHSTQKKFVETTTTSSSVASSSPEPTTPRPSKEDELDDEGRESPPEISSSTSDCSASHSGGRGKKSPPSTPPPPKNPLLQERFNSEELRHVVCHLETKDLWDKFNELGTEMIITKSGRTLCDSYLFLLLDSLDSHRYGVRLSNRPSTETMLRRSNDSSIRYPQSVEY